MKKIKFPTELAYLLGLILIALGCAFMEAADYGLSMIVAPAYLIHLKVSETFAWFTFGTSEYICQAVILVLMCLVVRRFKVSYLFSFVTAVLYGFILDGSLLLVGFLPAEGYILRTLYYVVGMLLCSLGVAFVFHTYIAPEVYELFVKEFAERYHKKIGMVKTVYDCLSCGIGIILSFVFFGFLHFEGVKLGTMFCALINGYIISKCTKLLERKLEFYDRFPFRKFFEK